MLSTYELTLPSTDVQVKFRPFLVKDKRYYYRRLKHKTKTNHTALKDIVSVCTFGVINVDELPTFDLEYVFLQIRLSQLVKLQN